MGPTPSPTSNQVIQLAEAVLSGRGTRHALQSAVATHLVGLEHAQRDFAVRLTQLGATSTAVATAASDVQASFRDYGTALRAFTADDVAPAIAPLIAATTRLLNALGAYELQELIAAGPSGDPYVNLLVRLARQYEAGSIPSTAYTEAVTQAANRTAQGYAALLREPEPDNVEALRAADADHMAAVAVFQGYPQHRDGEALRQAAERLERTLVGLNQLMQTTGMRRLATGPSRSAHVNILRNTLQGFAEGALPVSSWDNALAGFAHVMQQTRGEVDSAATSAASTALLEDIEIVRGLLPQIDGFVAEAAACRSAADAIALRARFDDFSALVDRVLDAFEGMQALQEQAGKVVCVRCGHHNPAGGASCAQCGAKLLRTGEQARTAGIKEGRAREMPMPPVLRRLLEAVNAIDADPSTAAAYMRAIDEAGRAIETNREDVEAQVSRQRERLAAASMEAEHREHAEAALEQAYDRVRQGSTAIRDGLQTLRGFVHDRDRGALVDAVRRIYEGFRQLYEVHSAADRPLVEGEAPPVAIEEASLFTAMSSDWSVNVSAEDDDDDDGTDASALLRGLLGD